MSNFIISIANEPILTFGLLLLIMLFTPIFFQYIKLPGIVGLLIAGILAGPNGFGLIEAAGVIDVLGKVGLLYLMFLAGLEINLDQFKTEQKNTVVFGAITFLIPQILGTVIFLGLGYSLPASLLIASMFASHTLVAYPIISRLGLIQDKSVSATVGGTIITDTAALLVLAIVARSVEGHLDLSFWITLIILFALYLVFMFYILPKISFNFFKLVGEKGRYTYVYVIGMMLITAWMAELIGIEAIVGAFLAGLSFNRLLSNKGPLKNRIEFFGDAFFIPLFLIYVGMLVDIDVLISSTDIWIVMVAMTLTVIVTKWLAAVISSRILGFDNNQAWVMFGLSNTQAAATLAAVFIGVDIGLIGDEVLNGAIMMILVTCIIGPMVVEKFGGRLAAATTHEFETSLVKQQQILIPISNPSTLARLVEFAANIKAAVYTPLYPLAVINTIRNAKAQRDWGNKILEMASGYIHAVNSESVPTLITNINIAEGIREAAEKKSITDIVIGWNGEISTSVRIFGSIVDQLLNTTNQQTFICKLDQPVATFQNVKVILSPKIISRESFLQLFDTLIKLGKNLGAPIELCHVSGEKDHIERYLKIISSDSKITLREFESFDYLMEQIINEIQASDLLVVTNNRAGDYGWAYGTNLIPRMMAKQKPDVSFVIAYPFTPDSFEYKTDLIYSN